MKNEHNSPKRVGDKTGHTSASTPKTMDGTLQEIHDFLLQSNSNTTLSNSNSTLSNSPSNSSLSPMPVLTPFPNDSTMQEFLLGYHQSLLQQTNTSTQHQQQHNIHSLTPHQLQQLHIQQTQQTTQQTHHNSTKQPTQQQPAMEIKKEKQDDMHARSYLTHIHNNPNTQPINIPTNNQTTTTTPQYYYQYSPHNIVTSAQLHNSPTQQNTQQTSLWRRLQTPHPPTDQSHLQHDQTTQQTTQQHPHNSPSLPSRLVSSPILSTQNAQNQHIFAPNFTMYSQATSPPQLYTQPANFNPSVAPFWSLLSHQIASAQDQQNLAAQHQQTNQQTLQHQQQQQQHAGGLPRFPFSSPHYSMHQHQHTPTTTTQQQTPSAYSMVPHKNSGGHSPPISSAAGGFYTTQPTQQQVHQHHLQQIFQQQLIEQQQQAAYHQFLQQPTQQTTQQTPPQPTQSTQKLSPQRHQAEHRLDLSPSQPQPQQSQQQPPPHRSPQITTTAQQTTQLNQTPPQTTQFPPQQTTQQPTQQPSSKKKRIGEYFCNNVTRKRQPRKDRTYPAACGQYKAPSLVGNFRGM